MSEWTLNLPILVYKYGDRAYGARIPSSATVFLGTTREEAISTMLNFCNDRVIDYLRVKNTYDNRLTIDNFIMEA